MLNSRNLKYFTLPNLKMYSDASFDYDFYKFCILIYKIYRNLREIIV